MHRELCSIVAAGLGVEVDLPTDPFEETGLRGQARDAAWTGPVEKRKDVTRGE